MGMGIAFTGLAVSGPAGVGNPDTTPQRFSRECVGEYFDLAQTTHPLQLLLLIQNGYTGRVVAAVFEALQTFQEDFAYIALRHCANNSTHSLVSTNGRVCPKA